MPNVCSIDGWPLSASTAIQSEMKWLVWQPGHEILWLLGHQTSCLYWMGVCVVHLFWAHKQHLLGPSVTPLGHTQHDRSLYLLFWCLVLCETAFLHGAAWFACLWFPQ